MRREEDMAGRGRKDSKERTQNATVISSSVWTFQAKRSAGTTEIKCEKQQINRRSFTREDRSWRKRKNTPEESN